MKNPPLTISNVVIQPGEKITLALPTPELYTCAPIYIPVHIIHGKKAGPTLLVSGAMHGDEINGVAITERLLKLRLLQSIRGTLIVIPTMNIYGMINLSRNLPDRRDLDGSFPGSKSGSFASRLAYLLNEEVFTHITHCIDLRTGEPHITKLPQVQANTENPVAKHMAAYFQAPVILHSTSTQGLMCLQYREENPIPTIVYETGEALRLDSRGIKIGVRGVIRVMRQLNMLTTSLKSNQTHSILDIERSKWVRAPSSGLCEIYNKIGNVVKKGERLARIYDPFGTEQRSEVTSPIDGIVVAKNHLPILNEGEPMLEICEIAEGVNEKIVEWSEEKEIY